ncbi:MAG: excisionase family DNA-binding protein [Acidobacteria bacterium]|nr:excisionase family DNA-binding protein [Acidobacteriota bacterium]
MESKSTTKLLTPEQAAAVLQVSKRTMYEWLRNGEIPSERIGDRLIRIRESDVLSPDARTYFEQGCNLANHPETVDRAEECFNKAISLNPRYFLAYFNLGQMFLIWSHYHRAIKPMKKAIELNPCFPAYMNLGLIYIGGSMFKEAEEPLRKALELQPTNPRAHHEIGVSIMMTAFNEPERMREAVMHFRKALETETKSDPLPTKNEMSARFLGEVLVLNLQDYNGARLFAQEIQETFPTITKRIHFLVELAQGRS